MFVLFGVVLFLLFLFLFLNNGATLRSFNSSLAKYVIFNFFHHQIVRHLKVKRLLLNLLVQHPS